ncbi:MAG: CopG family antitoxin [Thermomicrobiales bacterium]
MTKLHPTVDLGYPTEPHGKIPSFSNIEEEAEFWDTHDFTDFLEGVEPIRLPANQQRIIRLVVTLGDNENRALEEHAQALGITAPVLAHRWIAEQLRLLREDHPARAPEIEHGAAD